MKKALSYKDQPETMRLYQNYISYKKPIFGIAVHQGKVGLVKRKGDKYIVKFGNDIEEYEKLRRPTIIREIPVFLGE